MYLPGSTYRLQFNKDFTFADLQQRLPYLFMLGPGAVYASPLFKAVPGSNHGYDVTHPLQLNPEIGRFEDFAEIQESLSKKGIGWIQDIVPNHMAFHPENDWLMDVLRNGKNSEYAGFFDIDWDHPVYKNKIITPVLADTLDNIENGEITLRLFNREIWFTYGDFRVPVDPLTLKTFEKSYSDKEELCTALNDDRKTLRSLLDQQHYVLTHWQEVDNAINYRRFFTINGLISLRMEDKKVFDRYHEFILQLVSEGKFTGLRIDHVDGLQKPVEYFSRLRASVGKEIYIVAEKILDIGEKYDPYWPLQGTSGYDFMSMVNGLFTGSGIHKITAFYRNHTGLVSDTAEIIYRNKQAVLENSFRGDLDNIYRMIAENSLLSTSKIKPDAIREAIGELLVCCPVYKLYSDKMPLHDSDQEQLNGMFRQANVNKPHLKGALSEIRKIFINKKEDGGSAAGVFLRMMQYTGPLMAKGVEDTSMYAWAANIARNEVGDSLAAPAIGVEEFHQHMKERRITLPASMNATATHDTKRGEDTRARLSVISDIPSEWIRYYKEWSKRVRKYITGIRNVNAPDENERYFICQVILGSLPMDGKPGESYHSRLQEYVTKSLREAKIHTSWNQPDLEYENAVIDFCNRVVQDRDITLVTKNFLKTIRDPGIVNSLSQVVLKCMCPGIPDFYQGTELWDFSFVDPDNRREVDYDVRKKMLNTMLSESRESEASLFDNLYRARLDGRIKLWMIHKLMTERFSDPAAFVEAEYIPLRVTGKSAGNIVAFLRVHRETYYAVIIPLHLAGRGSASLNDTLVHLPLNAPEIWKNIFDNRTISCNNKIIPAVEMKWNLPLVMKASIEPTERAGGMLMHISSLPGKFGTGGLGEEARYFIDLLKKGGQKYWQMLPFNPTGTGYSPYSSASAFAGNMLFIDPEVLYRQHRIRKLPATIKSAGQTDFNKAMAIREELFREAFSNFKNYSDVWLRKLYEEFYRVNSDWLDDFALFTSISSRHGIRWIEWPLALRDRQKMALNVYKNKFSDEIDQIKFVQYLFHEQFQMLKSLAASFDIKLIGDIPIYVSYESADVWTHRELFNLDKKGAMESVAGVPPDFFSSKGQLWNMPVYNWKKMKENNYEWWRRRIKRNLEYFDLLRLDHFRALSAYWEVPAGETTAINGRWTPGPAKDLLNVLKKDFESLPLIAEDLGDIDNNVLKLRDSFDLPGMKVLMFAFDSGMPHSFHIPHNYPANSVVYTGTHDNNTVKGWYKQLDNATKERINTYLDKQSSSASISWDMIRMAMKSVSRISVIQVQDILMLGDQARMNTPARARGNWKWKLTGFVELEKVINRLLTLTYYSGRI